MFYALAPMDWITDTAYRQIVKDIYQSPNLILFTEFVSADGFIYNFDWIKDHLIFEKKEKPLICQIFWNDLQKLIYTAKQIDENYDFDWIDLNIGCPSPKIMKIWAWAWLMKDKQRTLEMIRILSKSIKKPFSIKTRAWIDEKDKSIQKDFIIKASDYCWLISIHARTLKQGHSWEADLDFVLDIKRKANPNCKIIFNWWINKKKLLDENFIEKVSLLDWIMIWQAAIWNPWIFVNYEPTWQEKKQTILKHLRLNIKYKWEKKWVIEFRKFIWNYIKWIKNASKHRVELMKIDNYNDFMLYLNLIDFW